MKKAKPRADAKVRLRRQAEERLAGRRGRGRAGAPADADERRLLQELEVHQLELEIQNEELVAARQETQAALERYTEIYEFAPVGYAVVGGDGIIRELNLEGARLLGLDRAKLVGRLFVSSVSERDRSAFGSFFVRVLEGRGTEEGHPTAELALVGAGGEFPAVLTATLVERRARSILLAIEDATLSKRAEAVLREADRRKDEFLAVLSHELRNPLAPIRNSILILQRAPRDGELADRALAVIERQSGQLARLVDDLLDVTRLSRGKMRLQAEDLDLNELARRTAEDHRSVFDGRCLTLAFHPCGRPLEVHADPNRLAQVIGNLLQNAAKFTAAGGRTDLIVSEDLQRGEAVVRVRDSGVGMEAGTLEHLFEPFMQADMTLDRAPGGLGLGLALVKGVVDLHGGSVTASSEGRGHGSEFVVRLPLTTAAARAAARPVAASRVSTRRVLIIEDSVDAADSLRDLLEMMGHAVEVACSGPEGIERARSFRPDFVLCDIGLPGMDGYAVARAFRADAKLAAIHISALSGYALPEDVERAREAGFDSHIAKPASAEVIAKVIAPSLAAGRGA